MLRLTRSLWSSPRQLSFTPLCRFQSTSAHAAAKTTTKTAPKDSLLQMEIMNELRAVKKEQKEYVESTKLLQRMNRGATNKPAADLQADWFLGVRAAVAQKLHDILPLEEKEVNQEVYLPFLQSITPDQLSVLAMSTMLSMFLLEKYVSGVPYTTAAMAIGRAVLAHINLERLKEDRRYLPNNLSVHNIEKTAYKLLPEPKWPSAVICRVGGMLLDCVIKTATVAGGTKPAFYNDYIIKGRRKRVGIVVCDGEVYAQLEKGHSWIKDMIQPRFLPMLVEPKPWLGPQDGGYLEAANPIIRAELRSQLEKLYGPEEDLHLVYQCLNILQRVPWTINEEVWKVVEEAWAKGEAVADLPPKSVVTAPPAPNLDFRTSPEEWKRWYKQKRKANIENVNRHSLRCDILLKLSVAREFVGKRFYYPHSMDFRGRTYPIPPHLNHLGSDLCRGLLVFADKLPLGERGFYWLKIQLSNLKGHDKVPFDDRLRYVEDNLDEVFDSADRPLEGRRWWLQSDDPWQCLACCFELAAAIRSGDPHNFHSCLPIRQDGTCNGLQHYAALGGDEMGATQVNLLPSDRPQDVYTGVSVLVNQRVKEDAARGHELAKLLEGRIERRIVKQTIMTSVYGVTFIGARAQIENAMKDRKNLGLPQELVFQASSYIARHTFAAIKQMFLGAKSIMDWLADCAKRVASAGYPVFWRTPLGLPIVQPYRKPSTREYVRTLVQVILLEKDKGHIPVNPQRQRSAFPPNFVHSLDSSHMMKTALACDEASITFASVHDSYWTHACYVDDMSNLLREQFVDLHGRPLLEELRDFWTKVYPTVTLPPVPVRGRLNLEEVKKSKYFFH